MNIFKFVDTLQISTFVKENLLIIFQKVHIYDYWIIFTLYNFNKILYFYFCLKNPTG